MIAVWDVKTGKLLTTFLDGSAYWGFDKIYFSPDGKKLLSYARDETTPIANPRRGGTMANAGRVGKWFG